MLNISKCVCEVSKCYTFSYVIVCTFYNCSVFDMSNNMHAECLLRKYTLCKYNCWFLIDNEAGE